MLKIKHLSVSSFGDNIVYINKNCSAYRVDDIKRMTKLEIQRNDRRVFAFLELTDDSSVAGSEEVALNNETFKALGLPEGTEVHVNLAVPSASMSAVNRKISGEILSSEDYLNIVKDIDSGRYSRMDIAAFLAACSSQMSATELVSLTEALVGDKVLYWDEKKIVAGQHCLGGVPGNKTDLIVLAITAAYGLPTAKSCIRSLTASAGVADTTGVMMNINLSAAKFQKLVRENNGAIGSYDELGLSKTHKFLYDVRSQLGINQNEFVIASVISMMISTGVTHLVLDIPVGQNARVRTTNEAIRIRKQIEYVGDMLGLAIDVVITDGTEPVGSGTGAVLEARDVMKVLRNRDDAPRDLREKSLYLAGRVLEFDPNLRGGQGYAAAREILENGRALATFQKIVNAQGAKEVPPLGEYVRSVPAAYDGVVSGIDNRIINQLGIYAGATHCLGSGLDLHKKVGDSVSAGEPLYTIYSCTAGDLDAAGMLLERDNGYRINTD